MLGGIKGVPRLVNCKHREGECDRDESVAYKMLMVEDYMEESKVKEILSTKGQITHLNCLN